MSRPHDLALKKLCSKPETLTQAQVLLHTASVKIGPGTGYDLGQGATGLPAICAYLASQQLGNADVLEKVAQVASCLDPKVFKSAVNTVRSALIGSSSKTQDDANPLTYNALIKEHKIGKSVFVSGCMRDVEKALVATKMLSEEFLPTCDILKITVFCWTSQRLLNLTKVNASELVKAYGIPIRDYEDIVEIIETSCQDVAAKVLSRVAELRVKVSRQSARAKKDGDNPSKSPSKPALRTADVSTSPIKTHNHKRKVAFATLSVEDRDLIDTPSKRRRVCSPEKASWSPHPQGASPAPLRALPTRPSIFPTAPTASSSQSTLDLLQRTENEHAATEAELGEQTAAINLPSASKNTPSPVIALSTPYRGMPQSPIKSTAELEIQTSGARSRRRVSSLAPALMEDPEPPRPRRFRPVFLDQIQWFQRDPKIEREWKMAEMQRRDLVQRC